MEAESNENNALRVPVEAVNFELRISYNVISHSIELTGFDKDPLIALGMMEFAMGKLKRVIVENEIAEQVENSRRIARPGLHRV